MNGFQLKEFWSRTVYNPQLTFGRVLMMMLHFLFLSSFFTPSFAEYNEKMWKIFRVSSHYFGVFGSWYHIDETKVGQLHFKRTLSHWFAAFYRNFSRDSCIVILSYLSPDLEGFPILFRFLLHIMQFIFSLISWESEVIVRDFMQLIMQEQLGTLLSKSSPMLPTFSIIKFSTFYTKGKIWSKTFSLAQCKALIMNKLMKNNHINQIL